MGAQQQSAILEAGTNEFEIIEFIVSGQSFGVNVSKVKQIIQFDQKMLTTAPRANPNVMGLFLFRGAAITLVDLHKALNVEPQENVIPLVLVTEFNNELTAFLIDGVSRIHRISWSLIQPINPFLSNFVSGFTGSINIEEHEILIIDLEQIVAEINPENRMERRLEARPTEKVPESFKPENLKIALAEDSSFMRKSMLDALKKEGFSLAGAFDNGLSAFEFVSDCAEKANAAKRPISDYIDILITDIEMPRMNGITLAKNIRDLGLDTLPIVVFSSIVNRQMIEQAKMAGVSSFISKPKIEELREIILKTVKTLIK